MKSWVLICGILCVFDSFLYANVGAPKSRPPSYSHPLYNIKLTAEENMIQMANDSRYLYSGVLANQSGVTVCSASVIKTSKGTLGVLTAGHCLRGASDLMLVLNNGNKYILKQELYVETNQQDNIMIDFGVAIFASKVTKLATISIGKMPHYSTVYLDTYLVGFSSPLIFNKGQAFISYWSSSKKEGKRYYVEPQVTYRLVSKPTLLDLDLTSNIGTLLPGSTTIEVLKGKLREYQLTGGYYSTRYIGDHPFDQPMRGGLSGSGLVHKIDQTIIGVVSQGANLGLGNHFSFFKSKIWGYSFGYKYGKNSVGRIFPVAFFREVIEQIVDELSLKERSDPKFLSSPRKRMPSK